MLEMSFDTWVHLDFCIFWYLPCRSLRSSVGRVGSRPDGTALGGGVGSHHRDLLPGPTPDARGTGGSDDDGEQELAERLTDATLRRLQRLPRLGMRQRRHPLSWWWGLPWSSSGGG